jgi:hypothetical protein
MEASSSKVLKARSKVGVVFFMMFRVPPSFTLMPDGWPVALKDQAQFENRSQAFLASQIQITSLAGC